MTRVVQDRLLKDVNGDINDHLSYHIHLTNCIHFKNHMHKHSPITADRSLMRELNVLQRSRSLRDPSASPPPSWNSPSIVDLLSQKGEKGDVIEEGRRSIEIERRKTGRKLSGSSPLASFASSKVAPDEVRTGDKARLPDQNQNNHSHDGFRENSGSKDRRNREKGKSITKHLKDLPLASEDMVSSNIQLQGRQSGLNRVQMRKFRGAKRTQAALTSRDIGEQYEMSLPSNVIASRGSSRARHSVEKEEGEQVNCSVTRGPTNGCGPPWNWSLIHHRGKAFLDVAGRSLSCGLSESRLRKGGVDTYGREISAMPVMSDHSCSSTKSNGQALPLLFEACGSPENTENANSGEVGMFSDYIFIDDSDIASEVRSRDQKNMRGQSRSRHQGLTQKYKPRTFRDLVGQNLVAQALSNAVLKKKVGLLCVFYGPHGTGKTSCARIFARALNCQSFEHPKPCGSCNSCIAYDMGKCRSIMELGPVSNFNFERIAELLDNKVVSRLSSQHTILIFDDCDALSSDCWNFLSKVIYRASRNVVFLLVSSSLNVLPHIIISRCQKFFFPKLKDADIIYTLQWIATKEDIEIDKDALKLIASRSNGSLRDAEMTLEQLSLLGQRISIPLVQELVGLVSDEKLVDLLDLALSADTVNTVKSLRVIMETGVDPLSLMSQFATVITDLLAGSYDLTKDGTRRKFFRTQPLPKEDMEKLRQALKMLSEGEKQLRVSNDKLTWLTAALLQLAPDRQYILANSAAETSTHQSPLAVNNNTSAIDAGGNIIGDSKELLINNRGLPTNIRLSGPFESHDHEMLKGVSLDRNRANGKNSSGKSPEEIEHIWLEVLEKINSIGVREFIYREGKMISVYFGAAPTVQLMFTSLLSKSTAEEYRGQIFEAFESVLGFPVTIEIRYELKKDSISVAHLPLPSPSSKNGAGPQAQPDHSEILASEIVEIEPSSRKITDDESSEGQCVRRGTALHKNRKMASIPEKGKLKDQNNRQSTVRSKVSFAGVVKKAEEGCHEKSKWSKWKAASVAEKLEHENLRLEPRYRNLLCWKSPRAKRPKPSRLKIRTRRTDSLLKLVTCLKYDPAKSPTPR